MSSGLLAARPGARLRPGDLLRARDGDVVARAGLRERERRVLDVDIVDENGAEFARFLRSC